MVMSLCVPKSLGDDLTTCGLKYVFSSLGHKCCISMIQLSKIAIEITEKDFSSSSLCSAILVSYTVSSMSVSQNAAIEALIIKAMK
jgi:hypothetical protein